MTLLQIQEPAPRAQQSDAGKLALGIDLGTTNSLVAAIGEDGRPFALGGEGGNLVPSAVLYHASGAATAGHAALAKRAQDPKNVIRSVKRLMGRGAADVQDAYQYDYAQGEDATGMACLRTAAGEKSPVEVSAEILKFLRVRAEQQFGHSADGAVVTVPAYFDEAQRQATKDAARLAGLKIYRLLNEPTAAAVAYGLDNAEEGEYAVYDLGGGTFDVSLLRMQKGVFTVLATGGDAALGGDDYDRALAAFAAEKAGKQLSQLPGGDVLLLTDAAREVKEQLSSSASAVFRAQLSVGTVAAEISAEEFAQLTSQLTARTIECCRRVLADAKVAAADIKQAVLVGGATRMPSVRQAVATFFGREPFAELNPDEVVALGAAAQADLLAGNRRADNWLLLDVIPLSLGLETMGGLAEKIITRNTAIPIQKSQEFTTHQDGQTAMQIHVVQGERELVRDCRSLAQFSLSDIPPMAAGLARVRVTFQVDADGLLSVSAAERTTGKKTEVQVKPTYGLDEKSILEMLRVSHAAAQEDAEERHRRESEQNAQALLAATQKALSDSPDLLTAEETKSIQSAIATVKNVLGSGSREQIDQAVRALDEATSDFAARKMNADIQKALLGEKIQE